MLDKIHSKLTTWSPQNTFYISLETWGYGFKKLSPSFIELFVQHGSMLIHSLDSVWVCHVVILLLLQSNSSTVVLSVVLTHTTAVLSHGCLFPACRTHSLPWAFRNTHLRRACVMIERVIYLIWKFEYLKTYNECTKLSVFLLRHLVRLQFDHTPDTSRVSIRTELKWWICKMDIAHW